MNNLRATPAIFAILFALLSVFSCKSRDASSGIKEDDSVTKKANASAGPTGSASTGNATLPADLAEKLAEQDPRLTELALKDPEMVRLYYDIFTSVAVDQGCSGCHLNTTKKAISSPHFFNGDSMWEFLKSWLLRKDTVLKDAMRMANVSDAELEKFRNSGNSLPLTNVFTGQKDKNFAWFMMRLTVHGESYGAEDTAKFYHWVKELDMRMPPALEEEATSDLAAFLKLNIKRR